MKRGVLGLVMVLAVVGLAQAGGWATTHSLAEGAVALTNTQANSSWVPVAVLWAFPGASSGVLSVERESQEQRFILASRTFTNVASIVWAPEAPYPFAFNEALLLQCSVTNGVVQVIRRGAE